MQAKGSRYSNMSDVESRSGIDDRKEMRGMLMIYLLIRRRTLQNLMYSRAAGRISKFLRAGYLTLAC